MTNKTQWKVTLEEDPDTGDAILPFPPALLEKMEWVEGDTILWDMQEDGSCILKKNNV